MWCNISWRGCLEVALCFSEIFVIQQIDKSKMISTIKTQTCMENVSIYCNETSILFTKLKKSHTSEHITRHFTSQGIQIILHNYIFTSTTIFTLRWGFINTLLMYVYQIHPQNSLQLLFVV